MIGADDAMLLAFRRNLVVAASAGTGKTHRLTALYVMLALGLTSMGERDASTAAPPCAPSRIIATTFSRAAAREIARRVERALVAVGAGLPHPFEAEIAARLEALGGAVDASDVAERARAAMAAWPEARIDTLHGVARRLVVRHAAELGQPLGAPLLDEDDAEALGAAAVDGALSAALEAGGDTARAARAITAATGSVVQARRRIVALLDRLDEEGLEPARLTLEDHAAAAHESRNRLAKLAVDLATSGSDKTRPAGARLSSLLRGKDRGFAEEAKALLVELFAAKLGRSEKRSAADAELDAFRRDLPGESSADRAGRLAAFLAEAPELAARERGVVAILSDARGRFAEQKRKQGALGFGDLLRLARDAMMNHPALAKSERELTSALLVDEFQDTSRVQRDLVYLLREREDSGRAHGESPRVEHLEEHGLFLVGDRKQSIYGFRGADVAVFAETCAELAGPPAERALSLASRTNAPAPRADFVALKESRRSGGRVLAFVNAFSTLDFTSESASRGFEIVYGPGEHLSPVAGREEEGEVIVVRDDGRSPEGAAPIVASASGVAREAHVAAAVVADETRRLGRAPRDVAVLARRRATLPLVELALARLDVPYVVAGRALYDAAEVRDVAALLALVLDPRDRLALGAVLRGPMVALSDPSLAALATPGRGLALPLLGRRARPPALPMPSAERARLDTFRGRYRDLRPALLALAPGDAVREAVRAFELDRVLAALPRAEARVANLDRLVTIARRRGGTLAGFSRWLAARIAEETDEPEAAVFSNEDDAVRLTTIHGSKGLDFPVVVLVDLHAPPRAEATSVGFLHDEARPGHAPTLAVRHFSSARGGRAGVIATRALTLAQEEARSREIAERKRLTYVAITRPRDKLVLIGAVDPASGTRRAGSAWQSLGGALDAGLLDDVVRVDSAFDRLASTATLPPRAAIAAATEPAWPRRKEEAPTRDVVLSTSALAVFSGCARRFRLRQLAGFEEPVAEGDAELTLDLDDHASRAEPLAPDDPRAIGKAAHALLERWPLDAFGKPTSPRDVAARLAVSGLASPSRESARVAEAIARFLSGRFAASLRERGAEVVREAPFALEIDGARVQAPRRLVLRGAVDLVARFDDGEVSVVDYKLTRAPIDLASHAFQLRAYALFAARASGGAVSACVVPLLGDGEPRWLGDADEAHRERVTIGASFHERFVAELRRVASAFAEARHEDRFDGVARPVCEHLRCGFISACHGVVETKETGPQLGLFG